MRSLSLSLALLLAALLGACGDANDEKEPVKDPGTKTTGTTKKEPVSPPMGLTKIQDSHKLWAGVVEQEEKKDKPDPVQVRNALKGIDNTIRALEQSIEADAGQSIKVKHARMRQVLGQMRKEEVEQLEESREIQQMLDDDKSGVAPLPAGHTHAELEDKLADLRKERIALDEKLKRHIEDMTEIEKVIAGGKPEPGDTMATRELEAIKALRKRAEALLAQ